MRKELLGLWRSKEGKCFFIEEGGTRGYYVSVTPGLEGPYCKRIDMVKPFSKTRKMPAKWNTLDKEYPFLQVEAGTPSIGPAYELAFAVANPDGGEPPYLLSRGGEPVEELFALPHVEMGHHGKWRKDLGVPWAYPLTPLTKASRDEEEHFLKFHKKGGFGKFFQKNS